MEFLKKLCLFDFETEFVEPPLISALFVKSLYLNQLHAEYILGNSNTEPGIAVEKNSC